MRLGGLTYKEILELMLSASNELSERSQKDFKGRMSTGEILDDVYVQEIAAIREIELAIGSARSIFEQTGKIRQGE